MKGGHQNLTKMDLEQQIQDVKNQLNALNKVRSHVWQLKAKHKKLEKLKGSLQKKVEKEFEEYQDIKHRNEQAIRNLFLLPDEEKLEQEKQEYFEAVLEQRKVEKEVELIQFEIGVLAEKLNTSEDLQLKLIDLISVRAVKKIKESQTLRELQQKEDLQTSVIDFLHGIRSKGQDNLLRIDEMLTALHQIELYGLKEKKDKYTAKRIQTELDRIERHLARLQVDFTMLESECLAYHKLVKKEGQSIDQWEKHLAPIRKFTDQYFLKADPSQLQQSFLRSRKKLIQLKYHLDHLIKESSFLLEEHQQIKRQVERDKAAFLAK